MPNHDVLWHLYKLINRDKIIEIVLFTSLWIRHISMMLSIVNNMISIATVEELRYLTV